MKKVILIFALCLGVIGAKAQTDNTKNVQNRVGGK